MRKARHAILAAGILGLGLVGCESLPQGGIWGFASLPSVFGQAVTFAALAKDGQVYLTASVDTTSVSMQDLLKKLGLPVTATRDPNGDVRIASQIPDGSKFVVIVHQMPPATPGTASQTKVFIEWENRADSQRGLLVLAELETRGRRPPNPTPKPG